MHRLKIYGMVSLPLTTAELYKEKSKSEKGSRGHLMRPSELPLYDEPDINMYEYHGKEKTSLQTAVSSGRQNIQSVFAATKEAQTIVALIYETGKSHSLSTLNYLHEVDNFAARIGAMVSGGVIGLLFAFRGRFLKKLIYSTSGVGVMACLCYPAIAKEGFKDLLYNANDYSTIGYNFIVGVKPHKKGGGDDQERSSTAEVTSKAQPIIKESDIKVENSLSDSVVGDLGQGTLDDRDLYTTRS